MKMPNPELLLVKLLTTTQICYTMKFTSSDKLSANSYFIKTATKRRVTLETHQMLSRKLFRHALSSFTML